MNDLTEFNEKTTAIANKSEQELFGKYTDSAAPGDTIYLTSYQPNELRYNANTKNGRSAVFSEIYFPWGWNITVDGQEVSMARVNYVLRGLDIPAGQHEIVFRFEPRSIAVTTGIAYASIIAILVLLAVAGIWQMRKSGNHRTNAA